jgi:hypothetical protein
VGDLDGDGDDDLIAGMDVAGTSTDSVITIYKNSNNLYSNTNFNSPVTITLDNSGVDGDILDIASYDIDGDGNDDIVAAAQDDNVIILKSPGGSTNTWVDDNWESASSNWQIIDDVDDDPLAIDVGNLVGSSDKDIAVGTDTQPGSDEMRAYEHPGTSPFSSTWPAIGDLTRGSSVPVTDVTIGDMDGDGDNDVAYVITDTDTVGFSSNDGDDTFSHQGNHEFTDESFTIGVLKAYDVDGDGDDDVIAFCNAAGTCGDEIAYLKSDGAWGWTEITVANINFIQIMDAVVSDFDGDGDGDMALVANGDVGSPSEEVYTIDNDGSGAGDFTVVTESNFADSNLVVNAIVEMDVGDDDNIWKDLVIAIDPDSTALLEIAIFENTIPEFTTLLAPIVSVIGIVCWNYRRREAAGQ